MKKLNRVEKKFLWRSIELYRFKSRLGKCDAKGVFWLRNVKQIYFRGDMYGCWIDEHLWVTPVVHSLLESGLTKDRVIAFCERLVEIAHKGN